MLPDRAGASKPTRSLAGALAARAETQVIAATHNLLGLFRDPRLALATT